MGQGIAQQNGGFEQPLEDGGKQIPGWTFIGQPLVPVVDSTDAHSGESSVRLQRQPQKSDMVGVRQELDARPLAGRLVRLSGWLRGSGVGAGSAGLWMRGQAVSNAPPNVFASSYALFTVPKAWQRASIYAVVPRGTTTFIVGAVNFGVGTMWVDDLSLAVAGEGGEGSVDPQVLAYVRSAIEQIRTNAYFSERVDWPALSAAAESELKGMRIADTHALLTAVLAALGDGHSFFQRSPEQSGVPVGAKRLPPRIPRQDFGRIGYVAVPGFGPIDQESSTAFADDLRKRLHADAAAPRCGWVVDLRLNGGGNMHPMLAGLAGFFDDETLGYFVNHQGRVPWGLKEGKAVVADSVTAASSSEVPRERFAGPVAVLLGPQTASSGEMVAVAFGTRPKTRTFGRPTAGLTTANQIFPLADGSRMLVTTALVADGRERLVEGKLSPDEPSLGDGSAGTDPALQDARVWLEGLPECRPAI